MSRFTELAFRHRSSLLLAAVAPIVLVGTGPGGPFDPWGFGLGCLLVAMGGALRLVSIRVLGKGARVHNACARHGNLKADGPYRWSRNPLYLAAALVLSGAGACAGLTPPQSGLLFLWVLLLYEPVVREEEQALTAQLGEVYTSYKARTPRWIGIPGPAAGAEKIPWREVAQREWRLVWLLVLPGLVSLIQTSPARSLRGAEAQVLALGGLTLGALGNMVVVHKRWARHSERRARKAEAEAAAAGAEPNQALESDPAAAPSAEIRSA